MSLVCVEDGNGHGLTLVDIDGYRLFPFAEPAVMAKRLRDIASLPCKEGDVFIWAPVKSGTHWCFEIVSMLLNGNTETIPKWKAQHMVEAIPKEDIADFPAPRVLNTHVNYKYLPKEIGPKKCKIVFPLRNPKDVAVSFYNHCKGIKRYKYEGKWEYFLPLFLDGKLDYGDWFDFVLEWEELMANNPGLLIHAVYYEDLKENNLAEIYRLGKFLGVENKDNLFEKVSEKCHFKNMKKDKVYAPALKEMFKEDFSMYRKGEIGDWKNWFTVAQNEMFDKIYAERMKNSKLQFRYEYSKSS